MIMFIFSFTLLFVFSCSCASIESLVAKTSETLDVTVSFIPNNLHLQRKSSENVTLIFSRSLNRSTEFVFNYASGDSAIAYNQDYIIVQPLSNISVSYGVNKVTFTIVAVNVGSITIGLNSTSDEFNNLQESIVRVTVVHNYVLVIINIIIGWIYFFAWSISFYPQVFINWSRKSVLGLNFDFVFYNLTGFIAYGVFNIGMFWIEPIKQEYHQLHPRGVNPVQLNDVLFTLHAVLLTAITLIQCCLYERGSQRVSNCCRILLAIAWLFASITLFVAAGKKITWLTYIYYFSYIKLAISLIKYIPQVWMNFRRKSTDGWSIGNVFLDFIGGAFSLLQMFLISYNNDDWSSIFGDPTKFGLGLFSILFDIIFVVQHYVLYRHHGDLGYQMLVNDSQHESR